MSFFEQVLVPSSLQVLPFPLDVAILVCPIGFVLIYENSQFAVSFKPHLMITHYSFLTLFDKVLHPKPFDRFTFVTNTQELLNFKLNRQPLAIPTRPKRHIVAFHSFPSVSDIFHYASASVTDVRNTIKCRRPLHVAQDAFGRLL